MPRFRPIVDKTSSFYYNVGSFVTELLILLTRNEFALKYSFDAPTETRNIPPQLTDDDHMFASFDMIFLFTNVPLNRTVNIVLDRAYNENFMNTNLRKRTLKKLIKGTCSETVFTANNKY